MGQFRGVGVGRFRGVGGWFRDQGVETVGLEVEVRVRV